MCKNITFPHPSDAVDNNPYQEDDDEPLFRQYQFEMLPLVILKQFSCQAVNEMYHLYNCFCWESCCFRTVVQEISLIELTA